MKLTIICALIVSTKSSPLTAPKEDKGSSQKPPILTMEGGINQPVRESDSEATIYLKEGFADFTQPIASYSADSQIPGEPTVFSGLRVFEVSDSHLIGGFNGSFELIRKRTEQFNESATFKAIQDKDNQNQVNIYLAKPLVFEKISKYTLTLQVRNVANLVSEAHLNIGVEDENNHAPFFEYIDTSNSLARAVPEHVAPGFFVMQVFASDNDGTYPNNRVTYSISSEDQDILDKFHIDPQTGEIYTKVELDRKEKAGYEVTIIARDGAEGSVQNATKQKFRIDIAGDIYEDQDVGSREIDM